MPSSVLNWDTSFQTPFPNKSLFPIKPRIFECTCFVWDVHLHVLKLDPKSLECIFLGYSWVQKGYGCYCRSLRGYLVSVGVSFLENAPFSLSSIHTSQREDDDLLIYTIASPHPASVKPLITQVYTRCQNPPVSSPKPTASTSNLVLVMIFQVLFVKLNVSVFILFPSFALITICPHIHVLLLDPWTLSLCLTMFLKPYLTLVGIVL